MTDASLPPPELWVVIGAEAFYASADREAANAHAALNGSWRVAKYELASSSSQRAAIPLVALWLDAEGVGEMLSVRPRQVRERIALRPDFPRPAKVGAKRWNAAEVAAWMRERRDAPTVGRRRRKV
jgi:predicted DNA-binding transcriptional regulator AlpA